MTVSSVDKLIRDAKRQLNQLKKISGSQQSLTSEITGTYGVFGKDLILEEPRREDRPFRFNPESPSNWDYWDFFYGHLTVPILPLTLEHINHAAAICLRADKQVGSIVYRMHKAGWPNHMRNTLRQACYIAIADIADCIKMVESWQGLTTEKLAELNSVGSIAPDAEDPNNCSEYVSALRKDADDLMFWVMVDYQKNPELWFESCGIQADDLPAMSEEELTIYDEIDSVKFVNGKPVLPEVRVNIIVNEQPISPRPNDKPIDDERLKKLRKEAAAMLRKTRRRTR